MRALKLTHMHISDTQISDLSPLAGMPLHLVHFNGSKVASLLPLKGMRLTTVDCGNTSVSDLSPLTGMPLVTFLGNGSAIADLSPLYECNALKTLQVTSTKVTGAGVAALQKALPNCKIEWDGDGKPAAGGGQPAAGAKKLAYLDPAFQAWVKATQALPAEQQVEAVSKKLMGLNPGFDGKVEGLDGRSGPSSPMERSPS